MTTADYQVQMDYDPDIVTELVRHSEKEIADLEKNIQAKAGTALLDFILDDLEKRKNDPMNKKGFAIIVTAMNAAWWINDNMNEWLGEKNVADMLSQSLTNNVTSEMGLALLDVADAIRRFPEVVNYLEQAENGLFADDWMTLKGGKEARAAINSFLDKYGIRCAGEIDITRTRWKEKPEILLPTILSHIGRFKPGESKRKINRGLQEALGKEQELLERLQRLPDGVNKVAETKSRIALIRGYAGYREYPKYAIVNRYFIYKQALLKEAEQLVKRNVISEKEDIFYLSFHELREVVDTKNADYRIIGKRKEEYRAYQKLTPPRVITSEGEIVAGHFHRENLPEGAIAGLAVSSGIAEGRARVILNMEDATLEEGDILVTSFTDPSWTPLFLAARGLVTEVGGLMTHGAVIAREYGLPAVVGVENATTRIKDGQRIRVHGTDGYIELLDLL
jgi:pyruvate,water dikinase